MLQNNFELDYLSDQKHLFYNPGIVGLDKSSLQILSEQLQKLPSELWFQTSGSSGRTKFIGLSKRSFLKSAYNVCRWIKMTEKDKTANFLPLFHVGGLASQARAFVSDSHWLDFSEKKWQAEEALRVFEEENITVTSLVPAQVYDLVKMGRPSPSSLRVVFVGGGRLESQLYSEAITLGWPLFSTYGMTEASSQVATTYSAGDWSQKGQPKLRVLPNIRWRIQPDSGQLQISGPTLGQFVAFLKNKEWVVEPLKVDDWYVCQDKVEVHEDEEGYWLQIHSRSDQNVKILGELVNLDLINQRLKNLLGSRLPEKSAHVVARKEIRKEHELVLLVEAAFWNQAKKILKLYNENSPRLESIENIILLKNIPSTPLGKVIATQLVF